MNKIYNVKPEYIEVLSQFVENGARIDTKKCAICGRTGEHIGYYETSTDTISKEYDPDWLEENGLGAVSIEIGSVCFKKIIGEEL